MQAFTVSPIPGTCATMEVYLRAGKYEYLEHSHRPCVLICPGGAYRFTAPREAEPVALNFLQAGYQVCILHYSTRPSEDMPYLGSRPLLEAAAAIDYIRSHSEEWFIDPDKITVCGFSAGGHVAGSIGVFGMDESRIPNASSGAFRPNAMVLCYPVVTGGEFAHRESLYNLTGKTTVCPENDYWSLEKYITEFVCPAFIWHPMMDDSVPIENSLMMATALQRNGVPCELHMFTVGAHGLSIATGEVGDSMPDIATWFTLCLNWLNRVGVGPGY